MGLPVGRIEDTLRIRKLADRGDIGVTFNLTHFLAAKDGAPWAGACATPASGIRHGYFLSSPN